MANNEQIPSAEFLSREAWYKEILAADPQSRIFFPYAKLLVDHGQSPRAVEILNQGLSKNSDFIEARLFLVELLHKQGKDDLAGEIAKPVFAILEKSPAFWEVWSRQEAVKSDIAPFLFYIGKAFSSCAYNLSDVFKAGIQALEGEAPVDGNAGNGNTGQSVHAEKFDGDTVSKTPTAEKPSQEKAFVYNENMPWVSLDAVPEDEDVFEPDEPAPIRHLSLSPEEYPIPEKKEEKIGKSSTRTLSMVNVLEEQGEFSEAMDICNELLDGCSDVAERAVLEQKMADLSRQMEMSESEKPQSASPALIQILEKLADRLETKSGTA